MDRLTGATTFRENYADWGGAIYTRGGSFNGDDIPSVTTFPDDTIFENNRGVVSRLRDVS